MQTTTINIVDLHQLRLLWTVLIFFTVSSFIMASSSAKKEETMFKSESSLDALGDVTGAGLEDEIDLILKEPVIDAPPDLPAFDNYDGYDCESFRFSNQMKVRGVLATDVSTTTALDSCQL
jgi:hypothetical protein